MMRAFGGVLVLSVVLATGGCADLDGDSDATVVTTTTAEGDSDASETGEESATTTTTEPAGVGDGVHQVGKDIDPGRYVAELDGSSCYWERLSGLSGDVDDVITNNNVEGTYAVVDIADTDAGFSSNRCGRWIPLDENAYEPATSFGDGDWIVGVTIQPGTYRTEGSDRCYWERGSGFSGNFDQLITNDNVTGPTVVEIALDDTRFSASRCGQWEKS